MAHAPFSPSSSKRWVTCTGSFGLSLQLPDAPSSSFADEGTRLHTLAAGLLSHIDPGFIFDAKDMMAVAPYVRHCTSLMSATGPYGVEEWVKHSQLLSGTPDFWAVDDETLHVVDLKTGAGISVSPIENAQLMTYAYMLLVSPEHRLVANWVTMTIVQPPVSDEPLSWSCDVETILLWGEQVELAIEEALAGSTNLVTGEHCRWCKAKPICPKLLGTVTEALPIAVPALKPLALAGWLDKAEQLQQWLDGLRTTAHALASQGHSIPGWTLKPKRATRQWADEDAVLEIARRRKIKIWQDKLMSPAMAEKAHPNMPAELTDQIVAISSGTNLVRDPATAGRVENSPPTLQSALKNLIYRT